MARATCYPEVVITKDGFQVTERWRIDCADELIAVVAVQIASLVATEQPALVKRCAGPGCTLGSSIARKRTAGCSAAQRRAGTGRRLRRSANVNEVLAIDGMTASNPSASFRRSTHDSSRVCQPD
jgi:hypothetical protein